MTKLTDKDLSILAIDLVRQEVLDEFCLQDVHIDTINKEFRRKSNEKKKELVRIIKDFNITLSFNS